MHIEIQKLLEYKELIPEEFVIVKENIIIIVPKIKEKIVKSSYAG